MIFPSRGPMKAERENFSPDLEKLFQARASDRERIADIPIFVVVRSRRTSAPPALLTRRRPVLHGPRARGLTGSAQRPGEIDRLRSSMTAQGFAGTAFGST